MMTKLRPKTLRVAEGATESSLFDSTIADGAYPLPGYSRRQLLRAELVAHDSVINAISDVLNRYGTLYAWAGGQVQPRALRGRAPVYVATIPDSAATTVVVRHSWHGGLFAPITRDRYWRPTRAPVELLRSYMLRECEIPTPEVVAFALYKAAPGFARVDVATRYLPDSYDFAAVLANLAPGITRTDAMLALTQLMVKLAANGFTHPDLNVKNVLFYKNADTLVAAVLDVDVMQWDRSATPDSIMLANATRLSRSMQKAKRQFGVQLTDEELAQFMAPLMHAASSSTTEIPSRKTDSQNTRQPW